MAQRTTLLPSYTGISSFKEGPSGTMQYRWPQPSPKCHFRIPTTPAQVQYQHKQKILTTIVPVQVYADYTTLPDHLYVVSTGKMISLYNFLVLTEVAGITYCIGCTKNDFSVQRGKCCHNPVQCVPPANLTCHKYSTIVSMGFLYIFDAVGT